jgi:hypothetical protein
VITLPSIYLYSKGLGYATSVQDKENLSLGNLGYSTMQCRKINLDVGRIVLTCPYGKIGKI